MDDTKTMYRVLCIVLVAGAVTITFTACASEVSGPVPDYSFAAGTDGTSAATSIAPPAATAPSTIVASTAPAGDAAAPGLPAVSNATDLSKKPGVSAATAVPSGLVVRDLVDGTGASVSPTARVNLKYVGTLFSDGTQFDSSWGRTSAYGPDTASFTISGVIPGFGQGLVGMRVGGRREIVIPPALGYGATANGSIPADSTLVFVVDVVSTSG
jgi:FKBP-type peptidyl-prolyl cis-trans isomerase